MIIVNLDVELAKKKMRSGELAERITYPSHPRFLRQVQVQGNPFYNSRCYLWGVRLPTRRYLLNSGPDEKIKSLKQFSHTFLVTMLQAFLFFFNHDQG